jgi:hypothetical protein
MPILRGARVWLAVTQVVAGASSDASVIEKVTCELVRPGVYRIDYRVSAAAGPVEVFSSSYPDRLDSAKPMFTIRRTPVEIAVPEVSGRVYFHLRPASGPT